MIIGIPREIMAGEARVSATPETVKKFVQDGMRVLVESGAGIKSLFYDEQYREAGAQIVDGVKEIYAEAALILKVKEPQYNEVLGVHEVDLMHRGQYLITFIHPASPGNSESGSNRLDTRRGAANFQSAKHGCPHFYEYLCGVQRHDDGCQ
jgi:NAD(P) transhydrogenase subunit alpha